MFGERIKSSNIIVIKVTLPDSIIPSFISPKEMMEILDGYSQDTGNTRYKFEAISHGICLNDSEPAPIEYQIL